MFDLVGYVSSYFATFGLAAGFLISAVVFALLLIYGFSIFLKASRETFKHESYPSLIPARARLVAAHHRKSSASTARHDQGTP